MNSLLRVPRRQLVGASAFIVISCVVWIAPATSSGQVASKKQPADEEWVAKRPVVKSVVLQLERDPTNNVLRLDGPMLQAICTSSAIVDPALRAALNLSPEEARRFVRVEAKGNDGAFTTLSVTLLDAPGAPEPEAVSRVIDEVTRRATIAVAKSVDGQIAQLKERRAAIEEALAAAEKKAVDLDARFAAANPSGDRYTVNPQTMRPDLERQRTALRATINGLKRQIEIHQKPDESRRDRPTSRPTDLLERLVQVRQEQLDFVTAAVSGGQASRAEQLEAEVALIEAKLKLAELSQRQANTDGSRSMVTSLQATLASHEAQLESVEASLEQIGPPATQPTLSPVEISELASDRHEARNRVRQLRQELDQFERQYGNIRAPRLIALTAEDAQ